MAADRAAGCTVLHVDMDAFFASVEVRRQPELAGTPVIVGGAGNRGVVTSATYEARRYGVHAAMPTARALRLCPTATVLPGDMALYAEVVPLGHGAVPVDHPAGRAAVAGRGLPRRLRGRAPAGRRRREIGEYIRARVFDEQGITCSVGVAGTKFVAKLASTRAKPDGLLRRPPGRGHGLPAPAAGRARCGASGPKTEETLLRLGLRTVGDLAHVPARHPAAGARARPPARTCTSWPGAATRAGWCPTSPRSSTGAEETFGTDVDDPAVIHRELLRLAERTAGRLRSAGTAGPHGEHQGAVRRLRHDHPQPHPRRAHRRRAGALRHRAGPLDALGLDRARIRLVGVRAERLVDAGDRAAAARARRPRARPAGRRAGRRPRGPPVRRRRGAAGDPAAAAPADPGPGRVATSVGRLRTHRSGPEADSEE